MIEMARRQRDIDVTSLTNWFAVIDGLKHREKARVFLDLTRNRIQIARPLMTGEMAPIVKGSSGGLNRLIDLSSGSLADHSNRGFVCWVDHLKGAAPVDKPPINEMPKTAAMFFEPRVD